jgi:hypothetical protein
MTEGAKLLEKPDVVSRSRFGRRAFSARMLSSSVRQGPIFGCRWTRRS